MNRDELRISNRPEEIERARVWAREFGHKYKLPRAVLDGLQISLDELLANVITYGYSDCAEHEILLRLAMVKGTLIAEIEDDALPFDPTAVPIPNLSGDLKGREVGGLGIHFVRLLNDRIIYERVLGKNRLRLEKVCVGADEKNGGERIMVVIDVVESDGVSTVAAKGRIDSSTAKDFSDRVNGLIRSGVNRLVIDFSNIAYISSAGFRALLIAGKLIGGSQGKLALCGMSEEVRRLFDIAGFSDLFLILPTREESITRVRAGS